jgi:hypothetical protein
VITCPECHGVGSVRVIVGDEVGLDRCPSCGGFGEVQEIDENNSLGDETMPPEYIDQERAA